MKFLRQVFEARPHTRRTLGLSPASKEKEEDVATEERTQFILFPAGNHSAYRFFFVLLPRPWRNTDQIILQMIPQHNTDIGIESVILSRKSGRKRGRSRDYNMDTDLLCHA